ncbi:MAG: hypothetical protein NXY57DRAFT_1044773, partial [Lentinula lateritia]
ASVSLDQPRNRFVTYSGLDFQLFSLANLSHIRTYQDEPPIISYPKQVAFAENGTKIVAGTDRGKVLIYNTESGQLDQTLIYVKGNLVQPVAAASFDGMHYIAAAGSTLKMPSEVLVWRNSSLDISTKHSAGNAFIQTSKLNEDPIIFSLPRGQDSRIRQPFSRDAYLECSWISVERLVYIRVIFSDRSVYNVQQFNVEGSREMFQGAL